MPDFFEQNNIMLVKKARTRYSKSIHLFLLFLSQNGFLKAPRPYDLTEKNELVSYLPGTTNNDPSTDFLTNDLVITSSAKLLREYHDVATNYLEKTTDNCWMLAQEEPVETICHNDFAPYNICYKDMNAIGLIDFETISPGPRIWDVVYALYRFSPFTFSINNEIELSTRINNANRFIDMYGRNKIELHGIVSILIRRLEKLILFMEDAAAQGDTKYINCIIDGHKDLYIKDIEYLKKHECMINSHLRFNCS